MPRHTPLSRVAQPLHGLDDRVCAMLRGWLVDHDPPAAVQQDGSGEADKHSLPILWDSLGMRLLPGGNFPVLRALELGTLLREPVGASAWLEILEEHASRPEDLAVWKALADDLRFLVHADQVRAALFLDALLERWPALACSVEGVRLIAWTQSWLPDDLVQKTVHGWIVGEWDRGPQAAGELIALRWLMFPDDAWAKSLLNAALETAMLAEGQAFLLGVAFTAAETWDTPSHRHASTSLIERLAVSSSRDIAGAVSGVFRRASGKAWDAETERVLRVAVTWPALLAADGHFLPDLLKEMLRDGMEPGLVGSVALGIVRGGGSQIGDARTAWASSAGDLFEIATALQRTSAVSEGIELFEALLEAEVYSVGEAMARFDRNRLR